MVCSSYISQVIVQQGSQGKRSRQHPGSRNRSRCTEKYCFLACSLLLIQFSTSCPEHDSNPNSGGESPAYPRGSSQPASLPKIEILGLVRFCLRNQEEESREDILTSTSGLHRCPWLSVPNTHRRAHAHTNTHIPSPHNPLSLKLVTFALQWPTC